MTWQVRLSCRRAIELGAKAIYLGTTACSANAITAHPNLFVALIFLPHPAGSHAVPGHSQEPGGASSDAKASPRE